MEAKTLKILKPIVAITAAAAIVYIVWLKTHPPSVAADIANVNQVDVPQPATTPELAAGYGGNLGYDTSTSSGSITANNANTANGNTSNNTSNLVINFTGTPNIRASGTTGGNGYSQLLLE